MAKKNFIRIERNDDLKSIDDELDEAMGLLSGVNQRVNDLLESYEGGEPLPVETYEGEEVATPEPSGGVEVPETQVVTDEFDSDDEDEDDDEFLDEDDEFDDEDDEDYDDEDEDDLDDDE